MIKSAPFSPKEQGGFRPPEVSKAGSIAAMERIPLSEQNVVRRSVSSSSPREFTWGKTKAEYWSDCPEISARS